MPTGMGSTTSFSFHVHLLLVSSFLFVFLLMDTCTWIFLHISLTLTVYMFGKQSDWSSTELFIQMNFKIIPFPRLFLFSIFMWLPWSVIEAGDLGDALLHGGGCVCLYPTVKWLSQKQLIEVPERLRVT